MLVIHSCDLTALIIHGNYNRQAALFSSLLFIELDLDPTLKYFSTKYDRATVKITQVITLTRCDRQTDGQNDLLTQCNSSTPNFPNWDKKEASCTTCTLQICTTASNTHLMLFFFFYPRTRPATLHAFRSAVPVCQPEWCLQNV